MAKDTLIELVQDILSDSDGDEINSISDTIEGQQCATVIRRIYQDIIETYDLQGTETAFKLEASGDAGRSASPDASSLNAVSVPCRSYVSIMS